jgi:hypothetical protein
MGGYTDATNVNDDEDIKKLLNSGFNVAEVVLPKTAPKNIKKIDDQLALFK